MKIELKILNQEFYKDRSLPNYATQGSAGVDLYCTEDLTLYPGETMAIRTGIAIHIGSNNYYSDALGYSYCGLIVPRSGLGTKGLVLANTIGVIDEDYQGEVIVQAWNRNKLVFDKEQGVASSFYGQDLVIKIKAGGRIAQLLFVPVIRAQFVLVDEFSTKTERGEGGFGSSGV